MALNWNIQLCSDFAYSVKEIILEIDYIFFTVVFLFKYFACSFFSNNLIVNTTPVGMSPDKDSAPDLCYDLLNSGHRLFDLVYNPAQTRFLEYGKAHGAKTLGGMLMLQTQAIASWHIWQRELAIGTTECTNGNVC